MIYSMEKKLSSFPSFPVNNLELLQHIINHKKEKERYRETNRNNTAQIGSYFIKQFANEEIKGFDRDIYELIIKRKQHYKSLESCLVTASAMLKKEMEQPYKQLTDRSAIKAYTKATKLIKTYLKRNVLRNSHLEKLIGYLFDTNKNLTFICNSDNSIQEGAMYFYQIKQNAYSIRTTLFEADGQSLFPSIGYY
jgi:hypothetical protein